MSRAFDSSHGVDGAATVTVAQNEAPALGRAVRHLWSLDPTLRFLNHGSYGATPRELQAEQDRWRARTESNPVQFFMADLTPLLREAATTVAPFVGTAPDRLVFIENVTSGVASILRSIDFRPGDEIVLTDHVYNAVRIMARHVAERAGATVIEVPIAEPVTGPHDVLAPVAAALGERTRLVIVDHVVSASALEFPVAELAALCRERGIPVLVDGAHGPGMLDLDVDRIGADWYLGNFHKWLCAPKGAAFLAVADRPTPEIHPTALSHAHGQGLTAEFDKIGTRDASAWLTVPAAIAFHARLGGAALRRRNRALALAMGRQLAEEAGTAMTGSPGLFHAMVAVRVPGALPPTREAAMALRQVLLDRYRVEAAVTTLHGALHLRISAQAYNEEADYAGLGAELREAVRTAAGLLP